MIKTASPNNFFKVLNYQVKKMEKIHDYINTEVGSTIIPIQE